MADNPIFDKDKRLSDRTSGMSRRELIKLIEKLCGIVSDQAGDDGFRGGVRPGNISLGSDGSVALGPGGKSERDRWTAEELEFMSPEEFWNGECGGASDVYSLGLVMYYCLCGGKLPFQPEKDVLTPEDRASTLRRRMSGERIHVPKNAGRSLAAIIEKALAFNAEDRYQSAEDMPVVLDLCLKELDSVSRPDGGQIFDKPADALTDLEKMMVGIISRAAEDAALSDETMGETEREQERPAESEVPKEQEKPTEPETTMESEAETELEPETKSQPEVEPKAAPELQEPAQAADQPKPESNVRPKIVKSAAPVPAADVRSVEEPKAEKPAPPEIRERTSAMPPVQYGMGKAPKQEKPEKKKSGVKKVLLILLACAAIIVVAIMIKSFAEKGGAAKISTTPTPAVSVTTTLTPTPTPTATPTPTSTPTPTPTPTPAKPTYQIFMADVSWTEAEQKCEALGGHLVVINDKDELDKVTTLAAQKGARFVWLGCYRDTDGKFKWVNKEDVSFYQWGKGEPSGTESDGTPENYVVLWNTQKDLSGSWEYNDVGNDPVAIYPKAYSGKIAYVCEIGG